MLFEPGPLTFLDPERTLPPRLTFGFETLATQTAGQVDGGVVRLAIAAATMASDLNASPTAGLDGPLDQAAAEQASQVGTPEPGLASQAGAADDLGDELDFNAANFPPENVRPPSPRVPRNATAAFDGVDWPGSGAPPPATGGDTGGGEDGGGNGGGGGDTGGAPPTTRELLERYMQANPTERPRIERFIADNPNDWDRAPTALGLPGWNDFVRRQV